MNKSFVFLLLLCLFVLLVIAFVGIGVAVAVVVVWMAPVMLFLATTIGILATGNSVICSFFIPLGTFAIVRSFHGRSKWL